MPGGMPQREENLPFELQVYAVMGRLKVPIGDKINHAQGGTKIVELDPTVLPRTGDWIIVAEAVAKYQRETRRDIDKHRLIVKPDISPPTVAITAPAPPDRRLTPTTPDGSEFKFDVTLAATDNVGVRRVEVQIDNVVLHHDLTPPQTGPISHTFQGVTFNRFGEGIPLVARAYDVKGQIGQEAVTVDAVDVTGPTVTISEPGAGVQVLAWNGDRGVSLAVKAGVKDVNGVSEVVAIDTADDERMMSLRRTADSGGIDSPSMWEGDTSFPGPGSYKIQITAYDDSPQRNPGYGRTIDVDVAAPIDPAGFSKTAYLRDLMDFAARRFTADNSKPLRPTILAEALYQPYDVFNRSDDAALERFAHEKVSYQRASIEILRIYIRAPESLASYCEAAYDAMLRALGSSARELRSALLLNTANAGQAERERVGDALGLETDSLGAFTLAESVEPTEFENKLKTLFGLAPTHRPAIHDVNNEVPLYQSKRIHRLRSQWRTADDEHDRPLLDPVVLKVDDLTEHGRNERAILEKRVKELSEVRKRLDRQRQSLVARYGDNAVAFEASATRLILRDLQSEPSDKVLSAWPRSRFPYSDQRVILCPHGRSLSRTVRVASSASG